MSEAPSTIFRTEALQYRLQHRRRRHSTVTYPRLMGRRVIFTLWALLGLLGLGGAAACFISVPASTTGLAIVMAPAESSGSSPIVALVPAEFEHRIEPGQDVTVSAGYTDSEISGSVVSVEPGVLDGADFEQRLGLPASAFAQPAEPVVLIWITVESSDTVQAGDLGRAEISVGSQRAGAFLPLVGRLFRGEA